MIGVFPILVTQGVNEMQTIANTAGSAEQEQFKINKAAVVKYRDYVKRVSERLDGDAATDRLVPELVSDIQVLDEHIERSRGEKNLQIIVRAESH
jgi:hypothetical protein